MDASGLHMRYVVLLCLLFLSCQERAYFNPAVEFPSLNQKSTFSISSAKEDILIINFFAPDCPPCIDEMPALKKYSQNLPKGVAFVGIGSVLEAVGEKLKSTDTEVIKRVKMFKDEYKVAYPVFLAGSDQLESLKVTGFPETLIFKYEVDGYQLKRRHLSAISYEELVAFTSNLDEPW